MKKPYILRPAAGYPPQTQLLTDRAILPKLMPSSQGTMRDIVTSNLPFWDKTALDPCKAAVGFAETFSQYIVEVSAGGG
jgi:(S)-ureidoglycine aminohydrolase